MYTILSTAALKINNATTAVGVGAGALNTGVGTVAVGISAGASNVASSGSTHVGYLAGTLCTGVQNTCVGYQSGVTTTTGTGNTCVGYQAGAGITTGTHNVMIGADADTGGALSNTIAIGYAATAGKSNTCVIGGSTGVAILETEDSHITYKVLSTTLGPLTAAHLMGGIIKSTPGSNPTVVTLVSAADLIAGWPTTAGLPGCKVGNAVAFMWINKHATNAITITAGVGCTLDLAITSLPGATTRIYYAVLTNIGVGTEAYKLFG